MIPIALAVLAATLVGREAQRRRPWAERVSAAALTLMVYALVPFIAFVNIAHLRITAGVGAGLILAYVALGVSAALTAFVALRVLGLPRPSAGSLTCVVLLANTGYLGLPIVVALLGAGQLATGVAYDQLVSSPVLLTAGFGLGAAFGTRAGEGARARLTAFVRRNPPLLAVVAGLIAPTSAAPTSLVAASHVMVLLLLPLGFFAVGVNLGAESPQARWALPALRLPVALAVALRMVVTPLVLLGLSALVVTVPSAYLLQATMPSGINALVVGHVYGLDLGLISAAIGWCTALALIVGVAVSVG